MDVIALGAGRPPRPGRRPEPLAVRLPARGRLDRRNFEHLVTHLAHRAVPGVEAVGEDGSYVRSLRLPHGPGLLRLRAPVDAFPGAVRGTVRLTDARDLGAAVLAARRMLDLDLDPAPVTAVLAADPLLAPLVARAPGRRLPRPPDPAEAAIRAVLGQQVSVAAARTLTARLVRRHGQPLPAGFGGVGPHAPQRLFPSAEVLAGVSPEELPMPRARARALRTLAGALADGRVRLDGSVDREQVRRQLLALPGIGPWTAELILLRGLGDPDAFPMADLVLQRALRSLGAPADRAWIARRAERWRPWRSYAAAHLWAMAA